MWPGEGEAPLVATTSFGTGGLPGLSPAESELLEAILSLAEKVGADLNCWLMLKQQILWNPSGSSRFTMIHSCFRIKNLSTFFSVWRCNLFGKIPCALGQATSTTGGESSGSDMSGLHCSSAMEEPGLGWKASSSPSGARSRWPSCVWWLLAVGFAMSLGDFRFLPGQSLRLHLRGGQGCQGSSASSCAKSQL